MDKPLKRRVRNGALEDMKTPRTITVLAIDPSMSNFGLVLAQLDPLTGQIVGVPLLRLVATKPSANKKTVRKSSDDLRRAREIHEGLRDWVAKADLVCSEMPLGSQNASAMKSVGMCLGILGSITKPLIQVMPEEVKLASVGTKTASKAEMIEWAYTQQPAAAWLRKRGKGEQPLTNANEHLADALAVIHASVRTDDFKIMAVGFSR